MSRFHLWVFSLIAVSKETALYVSEYKVKEGDKQQFYLENVTQ